MHTNGIDTDERSCVRACVRACARARVCGCGCSCACVRVPTRPLPSQLAAPPPTPLSPTRPHCPLSRPTNLTWKLFFFSLFPRFHNGILTRLAKYSSNFETVILIIKTSRLFFGEGKCINSTNSLAEKGHINICKL